MAFLLHDRILDNAMVNTVFPFSHVTFEPAQLTLNASVNTLLFCLCRPPLSQKNKLTDALFLSNFASLFFLALQSS